MNKTVEEIEVAEKNLTPMDASPKRGSQMSESPPWQTCKIKLWKKLLAIRKSMVYFQKNTEGYGYKYVPGVDVLAAWREKADELGVFLTSEVIGSAMRETTSTADGGKTKVGRIIEAVMLYTFWDVETGESLPFKFMSYGEQTDASKAFGSGLTYSERYFLLKFNTVPTDKDDPDARNTQNEAHQPQGDTQTAGAATNFTPKTKKGFAAKAVEEGKLQAADTIAAAEKSKSVALGDKLSTSHFISDKERTLWNTKKESAEGRNQAITYLLEKIRHGEATETNLYVQTMAGDNAEKSKEEIKAEVREFVIRNYTPLLLAQAKEKFPEPKIGV